VSMCVHACLVFGSTGRISSAADSTHRARGLAAGHLRLTLAGTHVPALHCHRTLCAVRQDASEISGSDGGAYEGDSLPGYCRVVSQLADVSEMLTASIIRKKMFQVTGLFVLRSIKPQNTDFERQSCC
jgi:hypothetical protein